MALSIYRKHVIDCPFKHLGRSYTACDCPITIFSKELGTRSLRTSDMSEALRKIADEQLLGAVSSSEFKRGRLDHASKIFLHQKRNLAANTLSNYRCALASLRSFCGDGAQLESITVETIDDYRETRGLSESSWINELTILRNFFGFCRRRKFCKENPAKEAETPLGVRRSREVSPYTAEEVGRIVGACHGLQYKYSIQRSLAAVLLMRHVGLRISDVAGLRRDSVSGNMISLRAKKNDKAIRLPMPTALVFALSNLPDHSREYYFWHGKSKPALERLLVKVFKRSGVPGATAHRFRHTLATELLSRGATLEDVADVLGDTPETVRKHYAKWSSAREERLGRLLGNE